MLLISLFGIKQLLIHLTPIIMRPGTERGMRSTGIITEFDRLFFFLFGRAGK